MTPNNIVQQRLISHQITTTKFSQPTELVSWYGALQAQDFISSKWVIASRLPDITEKDVEQAFADKTIVRSWFMRGTLQLVAAEDVHWMLNLFAHRVLAQLSARHTVWELDENIFKQSFQIIERLLQTNAIASRAEISLALENEGITMNEGRLRHILVKASYDKLICFDSKQGNDSNFRLLEPRASTVFSSQIEAIAELMNRYFQSHQPATLHDFAWWTGFSLTEIKKAFELIKSRFLSEKIDGNTYLYSSDTQPAAKSSDIQLLPAFDEYVLGYKDRSIVLDPKHSKKVVTVNGIFYPTIIVNGKVAGTWKRTIKKDSIQIEINSFEPLGPNEKQEITSYTDIYKNYSTKKLTVSIK